MDTKDSIKTISKSAQRFFSGTMLSRVTGLGREVLMAAAFGSVPQVAAFWMAFRFANLLRRMLGEGALNAAFIPQFEALRNQKESQAAQFFRSLSSAITYLLLFITILTESILGSIWLLSDLSPANQQIIEFTLIMVPAIVFISLYGLNSSLLNCEKSFFTPSAAPTIFNVIWIMGVILLWNSSLNSAMRFLSLLVVVAFFAQWLVTVPQVFRYTRKHLDKNRVKTNFRELVILLKPLVLGIIGVCASQINSALDAIFARIADDRGPAFLWYAIRIEQLPVGLIGVGLTGALLPPIARAIQNNDFSNYYKFLYFSFQRTLLFMIPITAFLLTVSLSLINLIYRRGEFSLEDTQYTASCLEAYSWGIVPTMLVLILASSFYAFRNYFIPTTLSLFSMLLNCALNAYFVYGLNWGAISIAVATSISAGVNCLLLAFFLRQTKSLFEDQKSKNGILLLFLKVSTCSLVSAILTLKLFPTPLELPRQFFDQLILFTKQASLFISTFLVLGLSVQIEELKDLVLKKTIFKKT